MKKVQLLVDGGHLRATAQLAKLPYTPDFIERVALQSFDPATEDLIRILYYDCAPFRGTVKLPISGEIKEFQGDGRWLDELARRDLFLAHVDLKRHRLWPSVPALAVPVPAASQG